MVHAGNKPKVQVMLESVFDAATEMLTKSDSGLLINAWLIQLDMEIGEVQVYDNREVLLAKNIIFEWAELAGRNPRLYRQALHFIRVSLSALKTRRTFDHPAFLRPFRAVLVDENFTEIEQVFLLEGSDWLTEGRLMKNLDHELQIFSKKIFAELE